MTTGAAVGKEDGSDGARGLWEALKRQGLYAGGGDTRDEGHQGMVKHP